MLKYMLHLTRITKYCFLYKIQDSFPASDVKSHTWSIFKSSRLEPSA